MLAAIKPTVDEDVQKLNDALIGNSKRDSVF